MRSSIVCTHNARTQILPMALAIRARLWSAATDAHYGLSPHIISNLFRERRERASFWSFVCLPFAVYGWFLAFFGANPWTNWTKIVNGNSQRCARKRAYTRLRCIWCACMSFVERHHKFHLSKFSAAVQLSWAVCLHALRLQLRERWWSTTVDTIHTGTGVCAVCQQHSVGQKPYVSIVASRRSVANLSLH